MICKAKGQNNAQAKRGAKYNDHVQSCPVYRSTGSNTSQYCNQQKELLLHDPERTRDVYRVVARLNLNEYRYFIS